MHKLQLIYAKPNQKQIMHEINKLYMLQTEEKNTRSVKENKSNFIDVIGDKFAMSIRCSKLRISFCKKLFSCKNSYLTLPAPCILESFSKIKINLNFYFHTSLWCFKRFYEDL